METMVTQPSPIRIMIIDTLLAVREGLGAYLDSQPDFKLVAVSQTGIGADAVWAQAHPDVVLLELELSNGHSLQTAQALRQAHPEATIIFLSNGRGSATLDAGASVDAASILPKGISGAELCEAIRRTKTRAHHSRQE